MKTATNKAAYFGRRVPCLPPTVGSKKRVMIVGERPGYEEAVHGEPFVGPAGRILNCLLPKVGIRREACWISNLVKSYQDRDPLPEEVEADQQELVGEINKFRPEHVVALGAFAARWFLGGWMTMDLVHGIPHEWNGGMAVVVPCYHPAAGLYNTNDLALTYWDLMQAAKCVRGEVGPPVDPLNGMNGNSPQYQEWHNPPNGGYFPTGRLAMDTEFNRGAPWGGSLSQEPGSATVFRPGDPVILGSECRILLHHALADLPILEKMGIEPEEEGQVDDSMLKAYSLAGAHPLGLKALAYRLCGMEMADYGEVIGEADRGLAMAYLEIVRDCGASRGGWGGKDGNKQSLDQRIAAIIKAVKSGKKDKEGRPVNPRERWRKLKKDRPDWPVIAQVEAGLGEMPEATLDDVPRKRAVWYSGRDADATLRVDPVLDKQMEELGVRRVYELDMAVIPAIDRMRRVGVRVNPVKLMLLGERMEKEMAAITEELGFNPDSPVETACYLFEVLGLKPVRMTTGGKTGKDPKASTDDRVLQTLYPRHPKIARICDYRECSKIKNSFCDALVQWMDEEGRIHTDLMQRANSGRFTAKEPNLLALPTRTELGAEIRDAVEAEDGCELGDWDYNQIEMRVMADESEDEELCRLFRAGEDVHANTACRMFGVTPGQMDEKKHRYPAKRIGFGVITGITGRGLVEQMNLAGANRDGRWTEPLCDEMIEEFKSRIYPGVERYMKRCGDEARRHGLVRDRWGRVRYLPGVWVEIPRVRAEAERAAHSHKIQGGAAGIIKTAIKKLWPRMKKWRGEGKKAELLLPVHDELLGEFGKGMRDEVNRVVVGEMEAVGRGIRMRVPVKADGGWGRTWREAHG